MQCIEGVEQFFLRGVFAGNELHIVQQQHINCAVFFTEGAGGVCADGVDQIVGEFLCGHIKHTQAVAGACIANGLQQVGFAEAHAAVQKERVVRARRRFADGARRRVRHAVVRTNYEVVKNIARVQAGGFGHFNFCGGHKHLRTHQQLGWRCVVAGHREAHLNRAPHNARQCARNGGVQTPLQPVFGVTRCHTNHKQAFLVCQHARAAQPCVKHSRGHLQLQFTQCRLPDLFRLHL